MAYTVSDRYFKQMPVVSLLLNYIVMRCCFPFIAWSPAAAANMPNVSKCLFLMYLIKCIRNLFSQVKGDIFILSRFKVIRFMSILQISFYEQNQQNKPFIILRYELVRRHHNIIGQEHHAKHIKHLITYA